MNLVSIRPFFIVDDLQASIAYYVERLGFTLEGETRSSYRYGDGKLHDEHLHARLATD